jgi:tRNA 2-selenouridine synthase
MDKNQAHHLTRPTTSKSDFAIPPSCFSVQWNRSPPPVSNMEKLISAAELLSQNSACPLLDVRSPGEFAHGHIPGAVSFPLFTDDERAQVGTVYKQKGKEAALVLGLEFVGPKMAGFVREAARMAPRKRVAVHCWRGGQRSRSMAWLLGMAGFEVFLLAGGYKNYRQHVLETFGKMPLKLIVIGGRTGTGKTKILYELQKLGEQIIDLEAIAHHKGSAFGWIGNAPQPSVEQFENDVFEALQHIDPTRRLWVENESRSIGQVFVPGGFWAQMKAAPLLNIAVPFEARVQNLLDDYACLPKADLALSFQKIDRKLGGLQLKTALEALAHDDFRAAAEIALWYYDKTYQHGLENNPSPVIRLLDFEHSDPHEIAQKCIQLAENEFFTLEEN